jgi:hypothetical protein
MRVENSSLRRLEFIPRYLDKKCCSRIQSQFITVIFSVFRVMMGAFPMYIPDNPVKKVEKQEKQTDL